MIEALESRQLFSVALATTATEPADEQSSVWVRVSVPYAAPPMREIGGSLFHSETFGDEA